MKREIFSGTLLLAFLIIALTPSLHANPPQNTWHVAGARASAKGDDGNSGTAEYPLASVQKALSLIRAAYAVERFETAVIQIDGAITNYGDEAQTSGMVTVRDAGAYPAIVLRGFGKGDVLDAVGRASVLYISGRNKVTIENLILTGGRANNGAGAYVENGVLIVGDGAVISGNYAVGSGGGILINGGTAEITGGIINDNMAGGSGGGVYLASSNLVMSNDALISGNRAVHGAGIYLYGSGTNFLFEDGIISGNTAARSGSVFLYSGKAYLNGGLISGNTSEYGGGIYMERGAQLVMAGAAIHGNTAAWGGGVYVDHEESSFTLEGGVISGNTAARSGGGVYSRLAGIFVRKGGTIQNNSPEDIYE